MMSVSSAKFVCEKCGAPALVNITNDEEQGPTMRRLCLACADLEETAGAERRRHLNYGAILISAGAFVLLLSILADWLGFDAGAFGWKQRGGLLLAGVLVTTAAIVQVPTLLVIGLLFGGLTLLADLVGFGNAPGFGLHQGIGTLLGVMLVAAGLVEARRPT